MTDGEPVVSPPATESRLAVALSGGGYRAAAFAAGALMYICDAGKSAQLKAISSVSGGSITNAYFATNVLSESSPLWSNSEEADVAQRYSAVAPLLTQLAHVDIIRPRTMVITSVMIGFSSGAAAVVIAAAFSGSVLSILVSGLACFVLMSIATMTIGYFALRRKLELKVGSITRPGQEAFIRRMSEATWSQMAKAGISTIRMITLFYFRLLTFRPGKGMDAVREPLPNLGQMRCRYLPIFCSTDLATGSHFYITPSFVAGLAAGPMGSSTGAVTLAGAAPTMSLATAVAASAAFPIVFQPAVVKAHDLGLPVRDGLVGDKLRLADGGLFDNFGVSVLDAWVHDGLGKAVGNDLGPPPNELIAVDSGQPAYVSTRRMGFLHAAKRSMDVVHQANGIVRRRELARLFKEPGLKGTTIAIGDDPYEIAERCTEYPDRAQAARTYLDNLRATDHVLTRGWWQAASNQRSPAVPTNLRALTGETVSTLVFHGYVAAMARTTVDLGWQPCTQPPSLLEIKQLCVRPTLSIFALMAAITDQLDALEAAKAKDEPQLETPQLDHIPTEPPVGPIDRIDLLDGQDISTS